MSDIAALGQNFGAQTADARTSLANNFEMFLKLLTEQLKNQDPLNPLDSTEFVNQLVNFSSVEQQIASNQHLESLLIIQSASAQASALGFIGREATVTSPQASLEGGQARWSYTLPEGAVTNELVIRDSAGRIVHRVEGQVEPGSHEFAWDGRDQSGAALPPGIYTLEVAAKDGENRNVSAQIFATGRVTGVDFSGSEVIVEMGAIRTPLSAVRSLREAASA